MRIIMHMITRFCWLVPQPLLLALQLNGAEPAATTNPLAAECDLRPAFTNWGLPLRHQGGRGTCSVFTVTGALEFALAHQQQKGTVLSVEFLNWASNEATQDKTDGGFFSDLWTGFEKFGICTETNFPYQPVFDPKRSPNTATLETAKQLTHSGLKMNWIKPWDVNTGLTDQHFQDIKATLIKGWPVCGGFRWPKKEQWQDGVLKMVPPEAVFDGHSVLLVGFKDDPNQSGGGFFRIRNTGGGEHDAALPYEYVRAYMNDALWIDSTSNQSPKE